MPTEDNPSSSPTKSSTTSSPRKQISPAKAKFAAIAGKAGIKVRTENPAIKGQSDLDAGNLQDRRRWRDVWKKRNGGLE